MSPVADPSDHPPALAVGLARVNVGVPSLLADAEGTRVWSGIRKSPVAPGTTLWLSSVNLAGDGQADLSVHGGPDKAVYAYPSEHLGVWADELGSPTLGTIEDPAPFGENLSTVGVTGHTACIGDRWRWDDALLEVCQPRWPCFKLALHRGRRDIQSLMRHNGRTGWYLRVLEPGEVRTDSTITVERADPERLSVNDAHLAMDDRHLDDRPRAEALAHHPALARSWRYPLIERLGR